MSDQKTLENKTLVKEEFKDMKLDEKFKKLDDLTNKIKIDMLEQMTSENETLTKEVIRDMELDDLKFKIEMRRLEREKQERNQRWVHFVEKTETPEYSQFGVCRHLSLLSTFSPRELEAELKIINTVESIKNKTNLSSKDKKELLMNIYGMASEDKIFSPSLEDLDFEDFLGDFQLEDD